MAVENKSESESDLTRVPSTLFRTNAIVWILSRAKFIADVFYPPYLTDSDSLL